MKYSYILEHGSELSVKKMCKILNVSRSGYNAWLKRDLSNRDMENERIHSLIKEVFAKYRKVYGSPRITGELRAMKENVNEKRVARLMKIAGISAKNHKKFRIQTTDSNHNYPSAPNLLKQKFSAKRANEIWLSDITYIRTGEGFGYLCAIKDLYDETIVGWSFERHMQTEMVIQALERALLRSGEAPKIFHSDRGVQYASDIFRKRLQDLSVKQSMSGKGNCYDNAPMESFFGRLKVEEVYRNNYRTFGDAKRYLFDYIEVFYNRNRRHSRLNYRSPLEFKNAS